MKIHSLKTIMFGLVLLFFSCQPPAERTEGQKSEPSEPVVKYGVTVKSGPMDSVLVKDYTPSSSLVVPESHVPTARFPVIDVHTHVYARTPEQVEEWVQTMDQVGIETTVILTGAVGQRFDDLVELYLVPYPNRFQLYCGILADNMEASDFSE